MIHLERMELTQENNEYRLRIDLSNDYHVVETIKIGDNVNVLFYMLGRISKYLEIGCKENEQSYEND